MPAESPLLSVLMPTHRGEAWLAVTLESLAAEADDTVEIILVDNSPDDGTLAIARAYADRLAMTILARPDMTGWTAQTNLAAAFARGRFFTILHQDDVWLPGRMAAVRRWIGDGGDAALHAAPSHIIDARGRRLGVLRAPIGAADDGDAIRAALLVQNFFSMPAPIVRRDAWFACGGLDEALWYTPDWDLWLKLIDQGPVRYHREPLTGFRIHPASQTVRGAADPAAFRDQLDRVIARYGDRVGAGTRAAAMASAAVNTALAGGLRPGAARRMREAAVRLIALGPWRWPHFLRCSRLVERVMPRVRARLAGQF